MVLRRAFRRGVVITVGVMLLLALVLLWQRQNIFDEIRLHSYSPPTAIAALVQDDELTPYAKELLYINQPKLISNRTTFNDYCPNAGDQTIVLGCYHGVQNGIYLYAVSDPTLNGVEQVTASHEMLHAAYDRLSTKERNQVDGWLENYYKYDLHDPRILSEIAAYQKTEPHAVLNEMHSTFGTEVANLPSQLEAYYKRYFVNRQVIVNYADAYQQTFTARENAVNQDDTELSQLKSTITANEATLQAQNVHLQSELQNMNQARDSGDVNSYNTQVPGYNQAVDTYNELVTSTEGLVTQYNQLVETRNSIALQAQNLENELSGTLTPLAQQ